MDMTDREILQVRPAGKADVAAIHTLIAELADFEDLRHQFVATVEDLQQGLFGAKPAAEAMVAEMQGEIVGYAIFFPSYSTFIGQRGLWLEDLYVQKDCRGQGIGKKLILAVGALAEERGCQRFEWSVLDWNQRAIDFYEGLGAEVMPDWRTVRLDREGIKNLIVED